MIKKLDSLFCYFHEKAEKNCPYLIGFVVVFGFSLFTFEFLRVFLNKLSLRGF